MKNQGFFHKSIVCMPIILSLAIMVIPAIATENLHHLETVLESPFLKLEVDADVVVPNTNTLLPIYESNHAFPTLSQCKEMFFGGVDADVIDVYAQPDAIIAPGYNPKVDRRYRDGHTHFTYSGYDSSFFVKYRDREIVNRWKNATKDTQAEGLLTTPTQAKSLAQNWIDQLYHIMEWGPYSLSACYAIPGSEPMLGFDPNMETTGFYIVEFARMLDGIPISLDDLPYRNQEYRELFGDGLQLFIDDEGIFRVKGHVRCFTEIKKETLAISLDKAIEILRDNMDYVKFYPTEPTCQISEVGLCYRLIKTLPNYDQDANARTEARPAWRFASSINRHSSSTFTIFIDAITGEVLPS